MLKHFVCAVVFSSETSRKSLKGKMKMFDGGDLLLGKDLAAIYHCVLVQNLQRNLENSEMSDEIESFLRFNILEMKTAQRIFETWQSDIVRCVDCHCAEVSMTVVLMIVMT